MTGFRVCLCGVLSLGVVTNLWGASPAIGMARAAGNFAVNRSMVSGQATLFDGALVETGNIASRLELANGSRIELNPNSAIAVHASEAVLEKGSGQFVNAGGYAVEARTLRIQTGGPGALAQVRLTGAHNVQVAALEGSARVFSKTGVLVARLDPGLTNTFDPYAAPPDAFDMRGCLLYHPDGGQIGLAVDDQIYQITGAHLAGIVGNRVHAVGSSGTTGAMPGVSAVVGVTSLEVTDVGGCVAAAARFPGWSATPPSGTAAVMATAGGHHTGLIIAGVAVVAAGGAILAVELSGKSK